ncbi:MAG TPA: glucose-1-phosphate thymidylyltransferase RfbA [Clostridiales bacterium]|nr:glucose-1-phosphate thymidylyltransferase RfbA [Clostridiales bacterium]
MKGIVLSAGKGTRLYPMTKPCCKPLLPIYDKPMICYPLATLLMAGITEILVIVPPGGEGPFRELLGDGSRYGVSVSYREQPVPRGIADAFMVGEEFIGSDDVCLILGDNIFYGPAFRDDLKKAASLQEGATVFGYYVEDPRPFGVVEIGENGKALSIEEKPAKPKSNYIIPGLYFYDHRVVEIAKTVTPSARGELEITAVNNAYLDRGALRVIPLAKDFAWFDTGTAESMYQAASAVRAYQDETGEQLGNLEAIAYERGLIDRVALARAAAELSATEYGKYLQSLLV